MPIPKPEEQEKMVEFINRCMDTPSMLDEYPNENQRIAVCAKLWSVSQ